MFKIPFSFLESPLVREPGGDSEVVLATVVEHDAFFDNVYKEVVIMLDHGIKVEKVMLNQRGRGEKRLLGNGIFNGSPAAIKRGDASFVHHQDIKVRGISISSAILLGVILLYVVAPSIAAKQDDHLSWDMLTDNLLDHSQLLLLTRRQVSQGGF